jgi:hypothetical protein
MSAPYPKTELFSVCEISHQLQILPYSYQDLRSKPIIFSAFAYPSYQDSLSH